MLRINDHDGSNRLLVGQIGIDYYKDGCLQTRDMGLLDPQAPTAIIEGERLAAVWESSPENRGMVTDSYDEKLRDAPIPDWVNLPTETTEPIAEHPDDPDLARAIDLSTDSEVSYDQDDYVELIAGKCGLDVVAEDYVGDQPGRTFDAFRAKTVGELLGLLQDTCMCNWWKRGSIIEIRSRDWYEARQWQIPESWLERWREVFKAKGILDIDELSQIAALTWDQCLDNVLADPVLAKSESEDSELRAVINDCSEALSIYNKLTPRQKARVFTEKGLDLTSVRNWKSLSGELWTDSNGITSLIMRGTKQRAGKSWAYQLRITSAEAGETKDIMDCRAITPVY